MNTDVPGSNEQLRGVRPVRSGMRMLMPDASRLVRCFTPAQCIEASDFLSIDLRVDAESIK